MNEIVRTNIKERLVKAIESEKLLAQDVAAIFQMHPSYISWFKNVKYWDKIGENFWERVLAWINSGQSLREYSEKHGKVLPEKKSGKESNAVLVGIVNDPKDQELIEPRVKVKPEALERRKKELSELAALNPKQKRLSVGEMVDFLLAEKISLKAKIDAIDVLLKHYIS